MSLYQKTWRYRPSSFRTDY